MSPCFIRYLMAIEWKRPMNPQPISPMFRGVTKPSARDGLRNKSRVLRQAVKNVVERRRHKLAQSVAPFLSRRTRRYMPAEQALLEGHQNRVDDVPCYRRSGVGGKLSLVFIASQDRGQGIFPKAKQPAVLLQRCLVSAEAFHDDQPQEVPVLVHDVDRAAGGPVERLAQRRVRLKPGEVLEAIQEAALLDQRLEKLLLRLEMIVDRGICDSCLPCYVAHGSRGEAPRRKEQQRRVQDLLPRV